MCIRDSYTPEEMFKICDQHFSNQHVFINTDNVKNVEPMLTLHFSDHKTVPGTRSFHYFQPLSKTEIAAKRISSDKDFSLRYSFSQELQLPNLQPNTYVDVYKRQGVQY